MISVYPWKCLGEVAGISELIWWTYSGHEFIVKSLVDMILVILTKLNINTEKFL